MTLTKFLTTVTSFSKILTAVLFASLPFVGFFVGIKYEQQLNKYFENRTTLNQYFPKPSAPYTQDESTANWKTFTDVKEKFSFRYPPSVTVEDSTDEHNRIRGVLPPVISFLTLNLAPYKSIQVVVAEKPQNVMLDNALGNGPHLSYDKSYLSNKIIKTINVDGIEGKLIESIPVGIGNGDVSDVVFIKDNLIYEVDLFHYSPQDFKIFNQILSTFKFLN